VGEQGTSGSETFPKGGAHEGKIHRGGVVAKEMTDGGGSKSKSTLSLII